MPIVWKAESFKIIGACFEVYNIQGHGFLEAVYQECLRIEFLKRGIPFKHEVPLLLNYKDCKLGQKYIADFVCFGAIILELKAHKAIHNEHRAQVINYLKATNSELGILINFGNPGKLEYQRFLNLNENSMDSFDS